MVKTTNQMGIEAVHFGIGSSDILWYTRPANDAFAFRFMLRINSEKCKQQSLDVENKTMTYTSCFGTYKIIYIYINHIYIYHEWLISHEERGKIFMASTAPKAQSVYQSSLAERGVPSRFETGEFLADEESTDPRYGCGWGWGDFLWLDGGRIYLHSNIMVYIYDYMCIYIILYNSCVYIIVYIIVV